MEPNVVNLFIDDNREAITFDPNSLREMWNLNTSTPPRVTPRRNPSVDSHFQTRQERRQRDDSVEARRNREARVHEALSRMTEANAGRDSTERYDCVCAHCLNFMQTRNERVYQSNRGYLCHNCYSSYFSKCENCGDCELKEYMSIDTREREICMRCIGSYFRACPECARYVHREDEENSQSLQNNNRCTLCSDNDLVDDGETSQINMQAETNNEDRPIRRSYNNRKLASCISLDEGEIVKSKRIFSAELEATYPTNLQANRALQYCPQSLGVTGDGSISCGDHAGGIEMQTPRLAGKKGEAYINTVCTALNKYKLGTNKTCGLHIHLSGEKDFITGRTGHVNNQNGTNSKTLMLFYIAFDDVIHSFLPKARRSNHFCKSIKKTYSQSEIENAVDLEHLEQAWYKASNKNQVSSAKRSGKHSTRYCGINMHTLLAENHLEIRYHSGTLNARKILEWINLHARIMDKIASGSINQSDIHDVEVITNLDEKTKKLFNLVELSTASQLYFKRRQDKFNAENDESEEEQLTIEN